MKFVLLVVAIMLIISIVKTRARMRRLSVPRDRFMLVRMTVFSWILGLLFLGALLFLPNKDRLLYLAPAAFAGLALAKGLKTAQLRARREEQRRLDIEHMKRAVAKAL